MSQWVTTKRAAAGMPMSRQFFPLNFSNSPLFFILSGNIKVRGLVCVGTIWRDKDNRSKCAVSWLEHGALGNWWASPEASPRHLPLFRLVCPGSCQLPALSASLYRGKACLPQPSPILPAFHFCLSTKRQTGLAAATAGWGVSHVIWQKQQCSNQGWSDFSTDKEPNIPRIEFSKKAIYFGSSFPCQLIGQATKRPELLIVSFSN